MNKIFYIAFLIILSTAYAISQENSFPNTEGSSMTFRTFQQNKLWRDKAVDQLESKGSIIHWHPLNDAEFAAELRRKFMEEAEEVAQAPTQAALIEELADVLEVMDAFCDLHKFSFDDIIAAKEKKHEARGGFAGRKFITVAEHPVGSYGEQYCLADPAKYPEIVE